jgi:hypothetical protein
MEAALDWIIIPVGLQLSRQVDLTTLSNQQRQSNQGLPTS